MRSVLGVALAAMASACGGASVNVVVDVRNVPAASDAPSIARVVDLGDLGAIPASGRLPGFDSDGKLVVGELVLIDGEDFGKLPTVAIGGRPAEALARTGGGGIIARVPPGVPTGETRVEVSHPGGKDSAAVTITRYALVVEPLGGKVHVLEVTGAGAATAAGALAVPDAVDVAFAPDGQAAYVLRASGELAVVVMTAGGGPKVVRSVRVPVRAPLLLAAAARAPVLAVVGAGDGVLIDLTDPRTPALYEPFALKLGPRRGPQGAALDPAGRTLAIVVAEGNRVVPFDVSTPSAPKQTASAEVLPQALHPSVIGVTYAPAGDQLWIAAGDTRLSLAAGHVPTVLVAAGVQHGADSPLAVAPAAEIGGAAAPVAVASARSETVGSGTSIRSKAKSAAVVVATLSPALVAVGDQPFAAVPPEALQAEAEPGAVMRTDLEGESQVLARVAGVFGGVAVSHDSRVVVASALRFVPGGGGFKLELGVTWVPLDGGQAGYLALADMPPTVKPLSRAPVALAP